jgi:hypothetical protein
MNMEDFIHALKQVVRDAAIDESISVLDRPPGRRPPIKLQEQSQWYHSLKEDDKRVLAQIIADTSDRAIFGFLCVLDGVRAVEDVEIKGRFELRYLKDGVVLLNPPNGIMLHDLYRSE